MIDTMKKSGEGFPFASFDDPFFQDSFGPRSGFWPFPSWALRQPGKRAMGFNIDMFKSDGKYVIECELPGFKKDDFKIEVAGHRLTISAETKSAAEEKKPEYFYKEREFGSYYRSIEFAQPIDEKTVDAKYENGILRIMLPVRSTENVKRVAVSS
jgi:HSP20 family protein